MILLILSDSDSAPSGELYLTVWGVLFLPSCAIVTLYYCNTVCTRFCTVLNILLYHTGSFMI